MLLFLVRMVAALHYNSHNNHNKIADLTGWRTGVRMQPVRSGQNTQLTHCVIMTQCVIMYVICGAPARDTRGERGTGT
ncbi:protein of unknown function [Candidatus Promineifilum breve]|uniref:Uncharacterized protein n=1 Tax=Candidatus Promineifilum breve TaxID=1806508 RepID=A0A160T6L3_9CHLR|nr:protein of unknown function [Candidatus Promineifilum breve]